MREREREMARRRRRREKMTKLMRRLKEARTGEEKRAIVNKLVKQAPWRYQEFQSLLS